MVVLKRKAEIICNCYKRLESYGELIQVLVEILTSATGSTEQASRKEYAMYMFELLAEYHLPQEQIVNNAN